MAPNDSTQILSLNREKRILRIFIPINLEVLENLRNILLDLGSSSKPIWVLIDSSGGDFITASILHNMLRIIQSPSIGIVFSQALSSANTLLQGCTVRLAESPISQIGLHYPYSRYKINRIQKPEIIAEINAGIQEVDRMYQAEKREIKDLIEVESTLHASVVLQYDLLDGIFLDRKTILTPEGEMSLSEFFKKFGLPEDLELPF